MRALAVSSSSKLKKNGVVLSVVPVRGQSERFISLAVELAKDYRRPCIVSLDMDPMSLTEKIKKAGGDPGKMLLVSIRKSTTPTKLPKSQECAETSRVMDLSMALFRLVDTKNPDAILLGPLTSLTSKNSKMDATKFIHYLANDSRKSKRKLVLVCTKKCLKSSFLKDVRLFVDKVSEGKK